MTSENRAALEFRYAADAISAWQPRFGSC